MKQRAVLLLSLIFNVGSYAAQDDFPVLKGPYLGQKPPGMTPEVFAPGIISTPDRNEFFASFSPDGKEFYFNRGLTIMVSLLRDGCWTAPKPASFSAGNRAHEAHVTYDNRRVFWGCFTDNGYAIYYNERNGEGWSEAKNAGMAGAGMCVTSDINGQVFITRHIPGEAPVIANVLMNNGEFTGMIPLKGRINETKGVENTKGFRNMSHPAVYPDGSYILFDCNGGSHPWVSFRQKDGTWGEGVDLTRCGVGKEFGLATISRDGEYIFFSGNDDIYWVSAKIVEELRPKQ